eukprot:3075011-Rhodomonas_salina.2
MIPSRAAHSRAETLQRRSTLSDLTRGPEVAMSAAIGVLERCSCCAVCVPSQLSPTFTPPPARACTISTTHTACPPPCCLRSPRPPLSSATQAPLQTTKPTHVRAAHGTGGA